MLSFWFIRLFLMQFLYAHDDLLSIMHLTLRSPIANYLNIGYDMLYNAFTSYFVGFFIGVAIANILVNVYSTSKLIAISCVGIFICNIIPIFSRSFIIFIFLRCFEGIFVSISSIALSIFVQQYLSEKDFHKFLKYHVIFVCVIEAVSPIAFTILCYYGVRYIFWIMSVIAILYVFNYCILDVPELPKVCFRKSFYMTFAAYSQILQSRFMLLLAIIGLVNGIPDFFSNCIESMLEDNNIFPYVLGFSSVGGIIIIQIILYIESKFFQCHNKAISMILYSSLVCFEVSLLISVTSHPILLGFLNSMLIGCMYSVEYICIKNLYVNVQNVSSIASIILLATSIGPLISYISGSLFEPATNMLFLNSILIICVTISAYIFYMRHQSNSEIGIGDVTHMPDDIQDCMIYNITDNEYDISSDNSDDIN